ncbi:MAG TPA: hypothetical protein VIK50_15505 [Gemmatimonadaceae bacterium]
MVTAIILAAAFTALPSPAQTQGSRIADEGSFTITVSGRTAGRENFRITAMSRGDMTEYVARADVTYGDRKITPELRTGPQGAVVDYQVTTRSGAASESWKGAVARGRLNATLASGRGTAAREYIVPAGALLLDDEIIHHHWFLVLRSREGGMPVVFPRRSNVQASITMSTVGDETLQIGNHDLVATHLRATVSGGEVHDIWVDKSGQLLKVALPSRALVAVRDDPPPA